MSPAAEESLHTALALGLIGIALPVALFLLVKTAPYGRHLREGWGPRLPARVGWIAMESPAVLFFIAVFLMGRHRLETVPLILLGLWQFHYIQRTFVYPFRTRASGRSMPVVIVASAILFNLLNAYLNARWISHLGAYTRDWLIDPRFLCGTALFFIGFAVNARADTTLIRLRRPGETGYKIPRGWLYERVCCPNYTGEILEWLGWAIACWSIAGLAFALFTIANLAPRAVANRRWYRETFPDFPADRKALVPFVI